MYCTEPYLGSFYFWVGSVVLTLCGCHCSLSVTAVNTEESLIIFLRYHYHICQLPFIGPLQVPSMRSIRLLHCKVCWVCFHFWFWIHCLQIASTSKTKGSSIEATYPSPHLVRYVSPGWASSPTSIQSRHWTGLSLRATTFAATLRLEAAGPGATPLTLSHAGSTATCLHAEVPSWTVAIIMSSF